MSGHTIGVLVAAILVAGCGQDGAEGIEGSAGNVAAVVEEILALTAEVDALADERVQMGLLELANPQLWYDRVARAAVMSDVDEAVTSGEWEQVRGRRNVGLFGADREAAESPLELVEWVRNRLRLERDSLQARIDAGQLGR